MISPVSLEERISEVKDLVACAERELETETSEDAINALNFIIMSLQSEITILHSLLTELIGVVERRTVIEPTREETSKDEE